MNERKTMLLRSRVIFPVSRPPIDDGAVLISGNRIGAVGRWADLSRGFKGKTVDLGERVLVPGLINAHCHLDYTALAGQFSAPKNFTDWLKLITTGKSGLTYSDYAESWLEGAKMLLRTGTTTVGDVEMAPELLPDVWTATPLRVISFLEMTGVKSRREPAEILRETLEKIESLPTGRCQAGLSPHAPYSTTPELLRLASQAARQNSLRVTTHVAESAQEFEMFAHGRGEMHQWLSRNRRDMSDCGLGSPVRHLERCGALDENLLAVHVNYLGPGDAPLLGKRKVNVAHCPRSHAYFRHQSFPIGELSAEGINICLGTDSLASVTKPRKGALELSLLEEMREFSSKTRGLPAETILKMVTINGARALGLEGKIGELSGGAFADMIAMPHAGKPAEGAESVVQHRGDVSASLIDGQWAMAPAEVNA